MQKNLKEINETHIIVDTNAFLRVLLGDIPVQKKAFENVLQKAKENHVHLLVPQIVIFEIEFVLRKYYHVPKEIVVEKLQKLVATSYLDIQDREVFIAALDHYSKKTISFVDCFLLCQAQESGAELFTFDKTPQKRAENS